MKPYKTAAAYHTWNCSRQTEQQPHFPAVIHEK